MINLTCAIGDGYYADRIIMGFGLCYSCCTTAYRELAVATPITPQELFQLLKLRQTNEGLYWIRSRDRANHSVKRGEQGSD